MWPIKIDFGRPNAEIGRKMASGQLLFLALGYTHLLWVRGVVVNFIAHGRDPTQ